MSKAVLVLTSDEIRQKAQRWVKGVPDGTRLTFAGPKRSLPQNDRLWAMLTEIAQQRPVHQGAKMNAELWKSVFMQALGAEIVFMPTLEGDGMFPIGHRSSELSKEDFSQLIVLIEEWCARQGVVLSH